MFYETTIPGNATYSKVLILLHQEGANETDWVQKLDSGMFGNTSETNNTKFIFPRAKSESTTGGQLVLAELKKAGIAMKDIAAATGLTDAALTAAASSPIGDVIDSSAAAVTASLAVVVAAASAMLF